MAEQLAHGRTILHHGDCREVLATLPANSVDAVITDPPYHLTSIVKRMSAPDAAPVGFGSDGRYQRLSGGFMGQKWDGGDVAFQPETWAAVLRVLKPGGHLLAMGGTRTFHRLACAIEDAGFEVRDMVAWLYGSGFPKSHDVSKGIDRMLGARREQTRTPFGPAEQAFMQGIGNRRPWLDAAKLNGYHEHDGNVPATWAARQWEGFGSALKPSLEPCCLARRPVDGTIAENVLRHGTGAINIEGCRVESGERETLTGGMSKKAHEIYGKFNGPPAMRCVTTDGRWPANVVHDGSDEVLAAFPDAGRRIWCSRRIAKLGPSITKGGGTMEIVGYGDSGSAARFFYTAKADADDRLGSRHPTVKPLDLMRYFIRLITPPNGVVLDCFAGTGTTGEAALCEGMRAILIERETSYCEDIRRRMRLALTAGPDERARESIKARGKVESPGPLFDGLEEEAMR